MWMLTVPVLAQANPLSFTREHLVLFAILWVPLGFLPGLVVLWHAWRNPLEEHAVAWALLVMGTSVMGLVAYWEHVRIQEKRAAEGRLHDEA